MDIISYFIYLLFTCLWSDICTAASTNNKTPLYFSYITTFTGDYVASGAIPMIDRALDQINSRTDILENYTLNYTTILDSECSSTSALDAFFNHFNDKQGPNYISSFCCGCSTATIPVAEISNHWNIPQVSFAAAASVLNDQTRFGNFFRTLPSSESTGILSWLPYAMKEFAWSQMGMITQQESLFIQAAKSLQNVFDEHGWILQDVLVSSNVEEFSSEDVFAKIVSQNNRIIVLNTYGELAISYLCHAYTRHMRYPQYVYILPGVLHTEWWTSYPEHTLPCSYSIIAKMVNGSISFLPEGYLPAEHHQTTYGDNIGTFLDIYRNLIKKPQYDHIHESVLVGLAYDAIWSLAIGLDIASKRIAAGNDSGCGHFPGDLVPLEQFDYYNEKLGCIMTQSMEEVKFTGITRKIDYSTRTFNNTFYLIHQERLGRDGVPRKELVATLTSETHNLDKPSTSLINYIANESQQTLWGGDTPPYDGTPVETFVTNSIALEVVYYTLASFGLVFVICCALFNVVFRNRKIIKLASPNLNYILLFGSSLLYCSMYFYSYSEDAISVDFLTVICNVEFLTFSIGYTSCFAVILSKQWRIYYIFKNSNSGKKKAIKDRFLLVIISVLVMIDLLIVLVDITVSKTRIQATVIHHDQEYTTSDDGIQHENFVYTCNNSKALIWLVISYTYKAVLQIFGLLMAFSIRKIKIKALNDSKEVVAIICINSIVLTLLVVTEFGLHSHVEIYAALFSLCLFIEATLFTGIVFIPKIVGLYRDPEGKKIPLTSSSKSEQYSDQTNQLGRKKSDCTNVNKADHATIEIVVQDMKEQNTTPSSDHTETLQHSMAPKV